MVKQYAVNTVRKKAAELTDDELSQCYMLTRRLRGMYIAAGEKWQKQARLAEMVSTEEYLLIKTGSGEVAAFVSFVVKDYLFDIPCLYVWELHVADQFKRRGMASELLEEVVRIARAERQPVYLRCFKSNSNALAFYRKTGFVEAVELEDRFTTYLHC